jgi:hypothetical protein
VKGKTIMGILQNKVTRRVALGSIAAGLGGTALALHALRSRRKIIPEGDAPNKEYSYALDQIAKNSKLPVQQVDAFIEAFLKEQSSWSKFHAVSANVDSTIALIPKDGSKQISASHKGFVSLTLEEKRPSSKGLLPTLSYNMTYYDSRGGTQLWNYHFAFGSPKTKFEGKWIEAADNKTFAELLSLKHRVFYAYPNSKKEFIACMSSGSWRFVVDSQDPKSMSSFRLVPPKAKSGELESLPELVFEKGYLKELVCIEEKGNPPVTFFMESPLAKEQIPFATNCRGIAEKDAGKITFSALLSDVTLDLS